MGEKKNTITIEVEVDENGKASAALKSLEGDVLHFTAGVNRAGDSGLKLKDIFAGNVLADFFKRGVDGAIQFGAQAVQASAAASDANRQLEFSATQAGLSYTRAAAAAEDFGRRVGASNTEAARTFSDLVRLADRAGRPQDIELIGKRFADLAAARGLKGEELSNLIGTILSGQDEGLNRLGLPDPSKLYAQYAAQIGKTADSLTEMEKAQAALNGVMAKGAEAEGQAEARLKSTAGQLDTAAASYENLKSQVGDTITTSIEFRDVLDTISDALSSVVTSHAEARRELALGLKTPEQIAQEERDGFGRQSFNALKGGASSVFSIPFTLKDSFALAFGQITKDEFDTNLKGTTDAIVNPGQRQYEARVAQLRQLQEDIRRQEKEAEEKDVTRSAKAAAAAERSALAESFETNLAAAGKEENLNSRLDKLKKLKEELRGLSGALDAGDVEKQSKKIDDAITETTKTVTLAVRTAREAVREFLTDSLIQSDKDNPFLSLFVRAQHEVEETRKKFLIFGEDFANEMARVKKESLDAEIALARFQSRASALKYEQEARRLSLPAVGLTGPEERALDIFNARLGAATRGVAGSTTAESLRAGLVQADAALLAQRQFDALQKEEGRVLGLDGRASQAARDALDAQYKSLFEGLSDELKKRVVNNPALRETFAGAFGRDAERAQRDISDSRERERQGLLIQEDARELLRSISASGLKDNEKVKEFLAVTGSLSERELTPDLRRARVEALRDAARAEAKKEKDAENRAEMLYGKDGLLAKLDRLITEKGIKVDAPPSNVQLQIGDGLVTDKAVVGAQPSAEQTSGFGY